MLVCSEYLNQRRTNYIYVPAITPTTTDAIPLISAYFTLRSSKRSSKGARKVLPTRVKQQGHTPPPPYSVAKVRVAPSHPHLCAVWRPRRCRCLVPALGRSGGATIGCLLRLAGHVQGPGPSQEDTRFEVAWSGQRCMRAGNL